MQIINTYKCNFQCAHCLFIYTCCNAAGYVGTVNTPKEILLERISKIKSQESCLECEYINKLDRKKIWEDRL